MAVRGLIGVASNSTFLGILLQQCEVVVVFNVRGYMSCI
jgi:hypothetical protein